MGNDGGTIAKGQDLRAVYATRPETQDRLDHNDTSVFNTCALSSLPLYDKDAETVVSDAKGLLYIKEKILEYLLRRKKGELVEEPAFAHIRTLDDLTTINVHRTGDGSIVCPVTAVQAQNKILFCYLRGCGCVFAYKVLVELRKHFRIRDDEPEARESECPACASAFMFNRDIVVLNPQHNEEVAAFNQRNSRYLELKGLSHNGKKKRGKREKRSGRKKTDNEKDGEKEGETTEPEREKDRQARN